MCISSQSHTLNKNGNGPAFNLDISQNPETLTNNFNYSVPNDVIDTLSISTLVSFSYQTDFLGSSEGVSTEGLPILDWPMAMS